MGIMNTPNPVDIIPPEYYIGPPIMAPSPDPSIARDLLIDTAMHIAKFVARVYPNMHH